MRVAWTTFNGGLASSLLESRYTIAKYPTLLQEFTNFIPQLHGSASRRPGLNFVSEISDAKIILPFVFNTKPENSFILVFSHLRIDVYSKDYGYITHFSAPYNEADLIDSDKIDISYAQVGDIVYLAHENYSLYKIMRQGSGPYFEWSIEEVAYNTSLDPPSYVYASFNETTPEAGVTYPTKNSTLSYKVTSINSNGVSSAGSMTASVTGRYPTEWVVGDSVDITWMPVTGATEYNIYKESAGYFGYIATATGTTFRDNNIEADVTDTVQEDWFPFADGNNPSIVAFHQQRMVLGGTKYNPQTFFMSRAGDFESFKKSNPLQADDPVEYTLSSASIDSIQWLSSFGDLLIGTSGAEFKVSGSSGTGSPVTAMDVFISTQSFFGSTKIPPVVVGNSVLHAQRYNAKVRDLYYSLESDGYAGNDLTLFIPNLFEKSSIKQWCFQQSPYNTLWIVRADGELFSLTYVREQDIYAWAKHETQGKVLSCCMLAGTNSDVVVFLVERERDGSPFYTLEYLAEHFSEESLLEDASFLDCNTFYSFDTPVYELEIPAHLQGMDFIGLVDGKSVDEFTIVGNKIIFDTGVSKVRLGLAYTSMLSMMPLNADLAEGSTLGLKRSLGKCMVKVHRSIGGKFGMDNDIDKMHDFKLASYYDSSALFSGEYLFSPLSHLRSEVSLYVGQDKAYPFEVLAVIAGVDFAEQM